MTASVNQVPPPPADTADPGRPSLLGLFAIFLRLGLVCFGGPVAHLGYFHEEFVRKRRWLDDATFADLVALCQFLPGPASSQLVFALGMRSRRLPGALLASFGFLLPSVGLMIGFAYGVSALGGLADAHWIHGLKLAAVAVVAQAVWSMGRRLCPDVVRGAIAAGAAAIALTAGSAIGQVAAIAAGGFAGWILFGRSEHPGPPAMPPLGRISARHAWAAAALAAFAVLLVALPVCAAVSGARSVRLFDSFYRSGSLVFGGGHVVLPLLRAELVPKEWISDSRFLAGYGAAQALPGPLFAFAAYLGTLIIGPPHAWLGGLGCLGAIYLPAWLLIGGALPFWDSLRNQRQTRAALKGSNAAVVGVLFAAFCNPVWPQGVHGVADLFLVAIAFTLLEVRRTPPWIVVALCAAAGIFLPAL